jgi:hypothetical protein
MQRRGAEFVNMDALKLGWLSTTSVCSQRIVATLLSKNPENKNEGNTGAS